MNNLEERVEALEKQVEALTKFILNMPHNGYYPDGGITHHERALISSGIGIDQFYKSNDCRLHYIAVDADVSLEEFASNKRYDKYIRKTANKKLEEKENNDETKH